MKSLTMSVVRPTLMMAAVLGMHAAGAYRPNTSVQPDDCNGDALACCSACSGGMGCNVGTSCYTSCYCQDWCPCNPGNPWCVQNCS
jgi:hypothetical protein